jgi:predicted RND superfamily exporter protein
LRVAAFIVDHRRPIGVLLVLATLAFLWPTANAVLGAAGHPLPGPRVRMDTRARDLFPEHPFIHAQDKFAGRFGNSTLIAIAMVVREGTIFTPENLARLDRITKSLDGWDYDAHTEERSALKEELRARGLAKAEVERKLDEVYPSYPVNHYYVRSLTHDSTRVVEIDPSGAMIGGFLIEELPETQAEADRVREAVHEKIPYVLGSLVSRDEKAALVSAGFVTDRLDQREVFQAVFDHVMAIQARESDANTDVYVTGVPILTGWILRHAWEIALFLGLAVLTIFALLLLYFRRAHGVAIPFACALVTVIWGVGFTGWAGIAFDPLILVIPMIITARSVSHTVQMAERFFEDYETAYAEIGRAREAKLRAATTALSELIVPGTLGIATDVAGLLVILVTTIPQMRNLGIFGAFWVAAIVITVQVLHPILICALPPPRESRHYVPEIMVRFTRWIGNATTHPVGKWAIAGTTVVVFALSTWIALFHSQIGEAAPGTTLLWADHPFNQAAARITEKFGGADTLVIYADGDRDNSATDVEPIALMERLERELSTRADAKNALSLVPVIRTVNSAARFGDPKFEVLPEDTGRVRGTIFQVRNASPPGALNLFLTPDGRAASTTLFFPDHKGDTIRRAVAVAEHFIERNPLGVVAIRLDENRAVEGAGWSDPAKLADLAYYALGPVLPTRAHTLGVRLRGADGGYTPLAVKRVASDGPPPWLDDFRDRALRQYAEAQAEVRPGEVFTWPASLSSWEPGQVDQWWADEELGIRAVAVQTRHLIVQDLKSSRSPEPVYQPTQSWARGVQFVMAGGLMGILAAVNEEVERGHLANITLIFFVIFVLHSVTYRSVPSGAIILLQIMTATLLSLAYMALAGMGLNINTLPVQSVGVGIGVDYAIYIVDRIRQEVAGTGGDVDEAIRRAIRTTGMAVTFTATTLVGGIVFWGFSTLRFQAEMAQLLTILMVINMLGAITVVPAFYSIVRPKVASSLLARRDAAATSPPADTRESADADERTRAARSSAGQR